MTKNPRSRSPVLPAAPRSALGRELADRPPRSALDGRCAAMLTHQPLAQGEQQHHDRRPGDPRPQFDPARRRTGDLHRSLNRFGVLPGRPPWPPASNVLRSVARTGRRKTICWLRLLASHGVAIPSAGREPRGARQSVTAKRSTGCPLASCTSTLKSAGPTCSAAGEASTVT